MICWRGGRRTSVLPGLRKSKFEDVQSLMPVIEVGESLKVVWINNKLQLCIICIEMMQIVFETVLG